MSVRKKRERIKHKLFHELMGVIIFALAVFIGISVYSDSAGLIGKFTGGLIFGLFGVAAYAVPVLFAIIAIMIIAAFDKKLHAGKAVTYIVLIISILSVIHVFTMQKVILDKGFIEYLKSSYKVGSELLEGGGAIGSLLVYPANLLLGRIGSYIFFFTAILICVMVITNLSLKKLGLNIGRAGKKTVDKFRTSMDEKRNGRKSRKLFIDEIEYEDMDERQKEAYRRTIMSQEQKTRRRDLGGPEAFGNEPHKYASAGDGAEEDLHNQFLSGSKYGFGAQQKQAGNSGDVFKNINPERPQTDSTDKPYIHPPVSLLHTVPIKRMKKTGHEDIKKCAFILEDTLRSFGITANVVNISRGPVVTRYELQPAPGVKVSRIVGLADDIALNLAAPRVRIEAPIPGKAAVGIEVPNNEVDTVYIRDILGSGEFAKKQSPLTIILGQDLAGKNIFADISTMPHMLIAGATGSGKSVHHHRSQ